MKILTLALLALLASCGKPKSNPNPTVHDIDAQEIFSVFETDDVILDFTGLGGYTLPQDTVITLKKEDGIDTCHGKVVILPNANNDGRAILSDFVSEGGTECDTLNGSYYYKMTDICQGYSQMAFPCGVDTKYDLIITTIE